MIWKAFLLALLAAAFIILGGTTTYYCPNCCGGGQSVPCCSVLIANTLHATISGGCSCINTSVELNWNAGLGGSGGWTGTASTTGSPCQTPLTVNVFKCTGAGITSWQANFWCGVNVSDGSVTADPSSSCNPLNLIFNFSNQGTNDGCCTFPFSATITVTA